MIPTYTTAEQKKHPAFILAVDASFFANQTVLRQGGNEPTPAFGQPINQYPHELFLGLVQSSLVIREREYLDNGITTHESRRSACGKKFKSGDPRYKQILPYLVVEQIQADGQTLFYPYRRTKQVGESRLAGNGSVGYGGHVDLVDVVMGEHPVRATSMDLINDSEAPVKYNSVIDLKTTIMGSLLRECDEEFTVYDADGMVVPVDPKWLKFGDLFILDNSNDVGELHLGIIMKLSLPTGYTLVATEDELAKLPAMSAIEMLADPDFKPENWTRIYLEHYVRSATDTATLGIDHGGVQVGQVEAVFLNSELAALEQGHAERNVLSVKLDENDPNPQDTVEGLLDHGADESGLENEQVGEYGEDDIPGSELDADGRRESELFHANINGTDVPLVLSQEEERKLTEIATQGDMTPESLRALAGTVGETEGKILNNLADALQVGEEIGTIRARSEPMGDSIPYWHYSTEELKELPVSEVPNIQAYDLTRMKGDQLLALRDDHILAMSQEQIAEYRKAITRVLDNDVRAEDEPVKPENVELFKRLHETDPEGK